MRLDQLRAAVSLLLCFLLLCHTVRAQNPLDQQSIVKPDPKRAKKMAELGAKEEAAGQYVLALGAYEEAARYAPFDVTIVSKGAALRSKLVRGCVENGERLALDGDFEAATKELAEALSIDPSNTFVLQRLQQMESMKGTKQDTGVEESPEGLTKVVPDKIRKSFDLRTDLKSAYEQVAAAYGIKAAFDPDLTSHNVRLRLQDVDFDTATKVLTAETGTFWRALNPKLIFVAADTAEKRKAFEQEIEQTFVLPASANSTDITELVRVVRELTGAQHIQQSLQSHSLTIRDTVQRVKLAGAIIKQIEQEHGEVLLEIELLEVDRSTALNLGITPPSSVRLVPVAPNLASQLRTAPSLTALLTILATVFGGPLGAAASGGLSSLSSAIPPIVALGGGKSIFLLTLPTASAGFSQSLSLVQSGRQILMRAQDGKPATFFLGERYPITLSLLSGSLGTTGFTPSIGGTGVTIPTEQFTVGQGPVALVSADFRNADVLDLAVLNQVDNSLTILLNQGTGATSQFAQATGSPILLGGSSGSATAGIVSAPATLTVTTATLQSIAVTPAISSLAAGGTQQFIATGTFSDGSTQDITKDVTWASTNTTVATIGKSTGLATGTGPGTAQITATLGSVVSTAATLTGTVALLQSIAITSASSSVAKGATLQFTATGTLSDGSKQNVTTSATWASSNMAAATVGAPTGLVTGVASGTAQITATLGSVVSPTGTVTVNSPTLQSISLTPASLKIAQGTSGEFTAAGNYSDGTTQNITTVVTWGSSTNSVGTIGANTGLAFGVGAGTTNITATQGGVGIPTGVAAGSLNSSTDSFPDLLVASQVTNSVMVLLGNGDGTFSNPKTAVTYAVGKQPSAIATGKFNSLTNSNLGFVVTNFADNTYSVFTGNGDGTFTQVKGSPFTLATGEEGPVAVTVNDFNGDGIPDLAIVNETSNNVTILEGNGDGTFKEFAKSPISVGKVPVAIASGSLVGSTGPALAVVNQQDNTLTVLLGNGDGTFLASSQSPIATSLTPSGVAIGSFLQGTNGGIAVTNRDSGTVTVYLDLGSGLFTNALEQGAGTNPDAIVAGEFTNSTFPDVVVTNDISGSAGQVTLIESPTSLLSNPTIGQQPYPGSEYVDIGVKVKATPTLNENNEVTLQLDFDIKSLAGSSLNGIPVISNRTLTQMIRLKEDETSLITGLLDREETKTMTGLPGFAGIPGIGYAFGARGNSLKDNELLILITPRKVRGVARDSKLIYAGRGDTAGRGSVSVGTPLGRPGIPTPEPVQPTNPPPENPPVTTPPPQGVPPEPTPQPAPQPAPGQPPQN